MKALSTLRILTPRFGLVLAVLLLAVNAQAAVVDEGQVLSAEAIRQRLQAGVNGNSRADVRTEVLREVYARRGYRSIWYGSGANDKARALLSALEHIDREGLNPGEYPWAELRRECLDKHVADLSGCELRLSGTLITYARDVGYGRFQPTVFDPDWHIDGDALNLTRLLLNVAEARHASTLQSLPPPQPAYRALRSALAEYRWLARLGGWPTLPEGPPLMPGDTDARVVVLRERLAATDGASLESEFPSFYGRRLRTAVEQFQRRHGLRADGVVGPETRAALNVSVATRIAHIRVNLERWRWMPRELPQRQILVNLPAFELSMMDRDDRVLRMRAIAGRADRPSPAFRSRLTQVVFNPEWTVPMTIVARDILPRLRWDPAYLERQQIKVLRANGDKQVEVDPREIDWQRYDAEHLPFVLRQSAGAHNSLGRLKFAMPNPYEIFLHDTPEPELFNRSVRSLSSGCIRLEKPVRLAAQLLDPGDIEAGIALVNARLASGITSEASPDEQVTVFLVYFTVWVDDAGSVQFREDIYNRNRDLFNLFSF